MKKNNKQRLFEVMSRLDKTFKPKLNEIAYDDLNTNKRMIDNTISDVFSEFDNQSVTLYEKFSGRYHPLASTTKVKKHSNVTDYKPEDDKYGTQGNIVHGISLDIYIGSGQAVSITPEKGYVWFRDQWIMLDDNTIDLIIRFLRKVENYLKNFNENVMYEIIEKLNQRKINSSDINENITNIDKRENLEYFLSFNNDDIYWKWINDEIDDNAAIQIIRDIDGIEYNPNIDYKKEYSSMSEDIYKDDSATSRMFRDTAKAFDPKGYEEKWKRERPNQTEPEVKPKAMNQFKKDLNERKPVGINPKYTHFALLKDSKKFVNGWDFKGVDPEDLKQDKMYYFFQDIIDMDIDPKNVLIGTVKKFQKEGLDPFDSNNWYKFNANGWQERNDLTEDTSTFQNMEQAEDYLTNYNMQAKDEGNSDIGFVRKYAGRHPNGSIAIVFEDGKILFFNSLLSANNHLDTINFKSIVNNF